MKQKAATIKEFDELVMFGVTHYILGRQMECRLIFGIMLPHFDVVCIIYKKIKNACEGK